MGARTIILLATLAANILLATTLVRGRHPASQPTKEFATLEGSNASRASSQKVKGQNGAVSTEQLLAPTASEVVNPAFLWAQLESGDYKEYIARLRAFGVPEKTIRDIIMADVQKMYRPKFAALRPPKRPGPANTNFWENRNNWYNPNRDMTKEQREQLKALQKEQANLIKTLLGENVYEEISKDSGYPDWTERMFGPIPKELRDKVTEMQNVFQEAQSEIYAKVDGYVDEDTQADLKTLQRKFRDELATLLSPEQVKEYELRSSDTANQLRWDFSSFGPNEDEFRAIFDYKQAKEDFNKPWSPDDEDKPPSPEAMKAMQQKQKNADDALAKVLGTDRLKEYKLMEDWAYRNLLEAGVPKESVFKVADVKTTAEAAVNKIRQDQSLNGEQKKEAAKAIRTETEKTLADLLGERRAKSYVGNGGWWLRNLAQKD